MSDNNDPVPGIYANISDEDYHAGPGVSNSGLRVLGERSPAHYVAYRNEPRAETPAKTLGKRIHRAVLEPVRFELQYAVSPKFDLRKNVDKAAKAEWEAENAGKEAIEQDDFDRCLRIRDRAHADWQVRDLLRDAHFEQSAYARDPVTGVLVRVRPDIDRRGGTRILADLKSCLDARREPFSRALWDYGYFQQAPFYLDVISWIPGEQPPEQFYFIAFEKEPPFAVCVYEASPTVLRRGREAYRPALDRYAECVATNQWPAYDQGVTQIDLPPYIEKRLDAAQNDEIEAISYVE